MTSIARSLLFTTSLYLAALGAVGATLYAGLSALAPAVQAHFLRDGERQQSRLDLLVANAREVRHALATPIAPVEPLPPITARPLRAVAALKHERVSSRKTSTEARNAYAMSEHVSYGGTTMIEDRYRPQ